MQAQDDVRDALARAADMAAEAGNASVPAAAAPPAEAPPAEAAAAPPAAISTPSSPPVATPSDPAPKETAEPTATAPAAEGYNKYRDFESQQSQLEPSPLIVPEDVVKQLLGALKNNDKPSANAGLSTVLRFSSPSNPVTRGEPEVFFGMMRNSQYSLLLGNFDTFAIGESEDLGIMYGVQTVAIEITLFAPTQKMMECGVDFSFMESTGTGDQSAVSLKWQLSKDAESECWLSDTLFFVPVKSKGSTMGELTEQASCRLAPKKRPTALKTNL